MPLNAQHYELINLPEIDQEIRDEFADLPLDSYAGGKFRYRRFSQYRLVREGSRWQHELLPHRPYCQAAPFNSLSGGMLRHFEPLRIDPAPVVLTGAEHLPLDTATPWQVDVHQWRILTNDDVRGVSVPEGPHQDGHTYSMIAVVDRQNITGGITQLLPLMDDDEPFLAVKLQPGQAVIIDDRAIRHNATDIRAKAGSEGHRDVFLLAYNAWDQRRYGDEYEAAVLDGRSCG
jgi:hypothetical protein